MITSRRNPLVKRAHSLLTVRGRRREGAFLLEGPRALVTALQAGAAVELVLTAADAAHAPAGREAEAAVQAAGVRREGLADELFAELTGVETPQGWLAVVRSPERSIDALPSDGRVLVLDGVRDPGNVGTLLRCADAVGAAVVLAGGCADPLAPKVARASAGSVLRTLWARCSSEAAAAWVARLGREAIVLDAAAEVALYDAPLPHPLVLVVGSEAHGPSEVWAGLARRRLPMRPGTESLNAAVATAVALYESVRQQGIESARMETE